MSYKPGDTYWGQINTANPTTGAAQNADSGGGPSATLYRNGTADGAVSLTVTNVATGLYKVTGTIPNTYSTADTIQVVASATVATVAAVETIDSFVLSGGHLLGDVAGQSGDSFTRLGAPVSASISGDIAAQLAAIVAAFGLLATVNDTGATATTFKVAGTPAGVAAGAYIGKVVYVMSGTGAGSSATITASTASPVQLTIGMGLQSPPDDEATLWIL